MTDIFEMILNLSLTGSVVILLVIAARIPLRRISRKYAYWLWSLIVIKLICPVSGWSLISRIKEMFSGSAAAGEVAGNAVKVSSAAAEAAAETSAKKNSESKNIAKEGLKKCFQACPEGRGSRSGRREH